MPKKVKTPKMNQRILDAALNKEPVFDAFKRLRKTRGNRKMDFVNFEWKYYQYYHGKRDLSIERSPENSSQVTFSDLPIHVLERVVGKSDFRDRLILQKVSSGLRNVVDATDGNCAKVELCNHTIAFEDFVIKYCQLTKGTCRVESMRNGKIKKYRINQNRRDAMMTDASTILENPRLKIDNLKIDVSEYTNSPFSELPNSLNIRLDVRSIDICTDEKEIRPILELVKPGGLEEIKLGAHRLKLDQLNGITETEQWKRAQKLEYYFCDGFEQWKMARTFECYFCEAFQTETLLHFKEIKIGAFNFTDENLIQVRDFLLQSDRLESCRLERSIWSMRGSEEALERFLNRDPLYDSQSRRFSIPNSSDYFEMEFGKDRNGILNAFIITKKTDR